MGEILKLLSQYPSALNFAGVLAAIGVLLVFLIYIGAFREGREISIWPPKIGGKAVQPERKEGPKKAPRKSASGENPSSGENNTNHNFKPDISWNDIQLEPKAYLDCNNLGISVNKVTDYILGEVRFHPLMFSAPFSSIPLIYLQYVLFVSWDGRQVLIERVLKREKAFPANDAWFSAVAMYRQATALPYRVKSQKELLSAAEIKRSIALYRKLIVKVKALNELFEKHNASTNYDVSDLDTLIDEAEDAIYREDLGTGTVRMEALLSTVHKFLLTNTPPTIGTGSGEDHSRHPVSRLGAASKSSPSILVIDDNFFDRQGISSLIRKSGYDNFLEIGNSDDALRALVENDFDLVITDGDLFGDKRGGRELAMAAKRINPKTRVIVVSNYPEIAAAIKDLPRVTFILKHTLDKDKAFKDALIRIVEDRPEM